MSKENETNIGRARQPDSLGLAQLAGRAFVGYPFEYVFNEKSVRQALENGEARYAYRDKNGGILGSAVLGVNEGKMAEIMRVMIDPKARQKEIATKLTRQLSIEAIKLGKYAWADVRGDQIGMQRAALGARLSVVSLEQGKHVVYKHTNVNGSDLGPARETMVHMTTLPVDEIVLSNEISKLSSLIQKQLATNLRGALQPREKSVEYARKILISASETRARILSGLTKHYESLDYVEKINNDIVKISIGESDSLVILPDASAFILKGNNISKTLDLLINSGIQIITFYCRIGDYQKQKELIGLGLEPGSIRPWVNDKNKVVWQIAWRKTANGYKKCLHTVNLDKLVKRQIIKTIEIIENSPTYKPRELNKRVHPGSCF